ncbi:unnamed protein product [marine sediment metagenome]|uniref:Uncharacterized protein n=1 Tax=marine sediment metagenome TaxID=412755 RepID=X0UE64_9ZZZZ
MADIIPSGTGDGEVGRADHVTVKTWAQMRSANNGDHVDDVSTVMQLLNSRTIGFKGRPDNWWLYRLLIPFDTGAVVPAGATINAATLGVYVSSNATVGAYTNAYVFQGNFPDETNLTTPNYNDWVTAVTLGGSFGVGTNGWKNSVFNADGLNAIRRNGEASEGGGSAGWTKIFIRGQHDYKNIPPTKVANHINSMIRTAEGANSPTLTVTWTPFVPAGKINKFNRTGVVANDSLN